MTATLDKTSDSWFHDFVLETFGLTPFVNTFPDFMAGGAVMITALFIAAGMEVSKSSCATVPMLVCTPTTLLVLFPNFECRAHLENNKSLFNSVFKNGCNEICQKFHCVQ